MDMMQPQCCYIVRR